MKLHVSFREINEGDDKLIELYSKVFVRYKINNSIETNKEFIKEDMKKQLQFLIYQEIKDFFYLDVLPFLEEAVTTYNPIFSPKALYENREKISELIEKFEKLIGIEFVE